MAEHQKDVEDRTNSGVRNRATRMSSASELHKSAITDHMANLNHIPDWKNTKPISRESNTRDRQIREAFPIRKTY